MENNENSSVSSNYSEEDELFDYIANQDENKVNNFLKRKNIKYMISGTKTEKILHYCIHQFTKKIST